MNKSLTWTLLGLLAMLAISGCTTTPQSQTDKAYLHAKVTEAIARFLREDPGLKAFFDGAYGYAVFPSVGKGAVGVGAAYGRGELYEQGRVVAHCDLSQATVGVQLGGQSFGEIIFFEQRWTLDQFKNGTFAFSAQASAVAVRTGAAASADYEQGVAVFTLPAGGLMFEASIGGQKFTVQPLRQPPGVPTIP